VEERKYCRIPSLLQRDGESDTNHLLDKCYLYNITFVFQLILSYLKTKVDQEDDDALREVARLIFDMMVMSQRFENELSSEKGIGKIFDLVCVTFTPRFLLLSNQCVFLDDEVS